MKNLTIIIACWLVACMAFAGWNKATYAIVNKTQLDAAIAAGKVNPVVMRQKQKGYPDVSFRVSLDGHLMVMESEKPGDIAYLRAKAAQWGIGYTEHTPEEMRIIMQGTNWTETIEEGQ